MSSNRKIYSFVQLSEPEVIIADNAKLRVKDKGTVRESISVYSKITERGYVVKFKKYICKIVNSNGDVVAVAESSDNIYKLVQPENVVYNCKTVTSLQWHRRLGHLNRVNMKLLRDKYATGLQFDPDDQPCEVCVKGKQARQPISTKAKKELKALKPLQLVHMDICGPMEQISIGGARYFILFNDDCSRRLSIYFLKNKNEALDAFKT